MPSPRTINIPLVIALLALPPIICFGLDLPHPAVAAIFITTIGLWLTEAVPLPATGLLVPVLAAWYGVLPAPKAFDSYGSDILFLFLGCFLMSRAMEKYGFDKRLAYFLLGKCLPGSSFLSINLVLGVASFALSMWISNTSAAAILTAVTIGILASLEQHIPDEPTRKRVSVRLLLTVAFAASIGGLATPVGSPPNLIAVSLLAREGIQISFIEWLAIGLPISVVMLVVMLVVFELCFPLRHLKFPGIQKQFNKLLRELGPMKVGEIEIAVVFLITIALWVLPGVLKSLFPESSTIATIDSRLTMSIVGLMGGISMFFLPVQHKRAVNPNLTWEETNKIEWGTLMLFGGGLTLGLILEQSGAAKDIGGALFAGDLSKPVIIGAIVILASILMSEFASNTAAAAILIPLIIGATIHQGVDQHIAMTLVLAATFGASFGFMLPVSTPPNAIVYGTGKVPAREMRRAGVFFDIAGALVIIGYVYLAI